MGKLRESLIAKKLNISHSDLSFILQSDFKTPYRMAKKIAVLTGTSPLLWQNGSPAERRAVFDRLKKLNGTG